MRIFCFLSVFILTMDASAGYKFGSSYHVGVGVINHNSGKTATDANSTSKPFLAETYSQLSLLSIHPISFDWSFSPKFFYGIPGIKSPEGNQTSNVFGLSLRGLYQMNDQFDFHFGVGLMYYRIIGSGGDVVLSNGSGTTTFATPNATKTSNLIAWDIGTSYALSTWRFEFSILITNLFNTSKLSPHPLITVSKEIF